MVRLWAEKEIRNLKRLHNVGIPSPKPFHLKHHVLVMEFLGDKKGNPAPLLKDVHFDESEEAYQWRKLYFTCVSYMQIMYNECDLVHGDLSEYNILYHRGKLYIIDVSQSVGLDHPRALEFLRIDIHNVNDFFRRKGVDVFLERDLFEFINSYPADEPENTHRDNLFTLKQMEMDQRNLTREDRERLEQEDAIFRSQHIPVTLDDSEMDMDADTMWDPEIFDSRYKDLLAYKAEYAESEDDPEWTDVTGWYDDNEEVSEGSEGDDEDENEGGSVADKKRPRGHRHEDKHEKKVRNHGMMMFHFFLARLLTTTIGSEKPNQG